MPTTQSTGDKVRRNHHRRVDAAPVVRVPMTKDEAADANRGATTEWDNKGASARAVRGATARARSGKPRGIDPTTSDRDYAPDEMEFMGAMAEYIRVSGRKFPTFSETLAVLKGLGYSKAPEVITVFTGYKERAVRSDSGTGHRGVSRMPGGKYRAFVWRDGRRVGVGTFDTAQEAAEARKHA